MDLYLQLYINRRKQINFNSDKVRIFDNPLASYLIMLYLFPESIHAMHINTHAYIKLIGGGKGGLQPHLPEFKGAP